MINVNIINMQAYAELLRVNNCLMASFAVFIGASLSPNIDLLNVFLACIVAFIVCGAGNAINDFYDYEIDKISKPNRPLPSGRISLKKAYLFSMLLFLLGVALSLFINIYAFLLALFNSILLYLYARKIKRAGGFTKNITVSYLVASPFVFGGIAVSNPSVSIILAVLAFLANVSREIIKDIEDYEGDRSFVRTLPAIYGFRKSAVIASLFLILAVILSPLPYILNLLDKKYLIAVIFVDIMFIYTVFSFLKNVNKENSIKTQKRIKIVMFLALLAFVLGRI